MRRRMMMDISELPFESQYLTFEALESGTFSFTNSVEYKIGNNAWQTLSSGESTPIVPQGEKIKWRGNLINPGVNVGIGTFSSTGRYNAEGNSLSLVLYNRFAGVKVMPNKIHLFCRLFYQDANLVSTKNLKLVCTTLRYGCYQEMFSGCTSLVESPELPATTLATRCYAQMFINCSHLTKAPTILPATILVENCYTEMFQYCTSLTIAPELPATTLTSYCYTRMFRGCTRLAYVKCLATNISANYCVYNWMLQVRSTGTFIKASGMEDWIRGASGIPSGWTIEEE